MPAGNFKKLKIKKNEKLKNDPLSSDNIYTLYNNRLQ